MTEMEMLQAMEKLLANRLQPIESRLSAIEENQIQMNAQLQAVRISVDQDISRKLDLLMGQHAEIIAQQKTTADYPETKSRVSTLETVVQGHTRDIEEIREKTAI